MANNLSTSKPLRVLALLILVCLARPTLADSKEPVERGRAGSQTATRSVLPASVDALMWAQFPQKFESKYFVFYSTIPLDRLQAYAHFADMFLDLVDRDFIHLRPPTKLNAAVLSNKAEFQRFLVQQMNLSRPPSYGVYLQQKNLFVTYDGSGLGTFSHEIMHYVVETMLPDRPSWAAEGIPTFFEKFYGYEQFGQLALKWGFQNPWRIEALGDRIPKLRLIRIIYGSEDESELRLLSVFLYQQGKLKTFLDLIQQGDKKGFRTYVEAAFNKPMYEIEGTWQDYLNAVYAKRSRLANLPGSRYFQTAQEFAAFEKEQLVGLQD